MARRQRAIAATDAPTNRGDHMDLGYVKKLVRLLSESEVDEIEIEEEGQKIRLAKHSRNNEAARQTGIPSPQVFAQSPAPPTAPAVPADRPPNPPAPIEPQPAAKYHEIKSPIVGTFYRAPAPDAAPFVELGSTIEPGTVLCIVEAMKLMNEIESDVSGKIVKILVENGLPVEYDQGLFLVEKR